MQASLMRSFLFLRFFAVTGVCRFSMAESRRGYVFGSENTWERSDLIMGPKSALVLPSAAKVIDRNVERIGG